MGRRAFTDFIQIKNVREGFWVDGKMVSVYFDLIIGPFTIKGASWHQKSGSIRLNAGRRVFVKGSYVETIRSLIVAAIGEIRSQN